MASKSLELSLGVESSYVPKPISKLIDDMSNINRISDKVLFLNDHLHQHQEELRRVETLDHDFPYCKLYLVDAIEKLQEEIKNLKDLEESNFESQPEIEFLPTKKKYYEDQQRIFSDDSGINEQGLLMMRSSANAQHWNLNPDKRQKTILDTTQIANLAPIQPCIRRNKEISLMAPSGSSNFLESEETQRGKEVARGLGTQSSRAEAINHDGLTIRTDPITLNSHPTPLTQNITKHNRISWSPELHTKFLEALNILGGVDVATPKQIKEVIQVDGLTNDQIKSHLQKYRQQIKLQEAQADSANGLLYANNQWRYYNP